MGGGWWRRRPAARVVPALAEREKQREQERQDQQPVADRTSIAAAPADGAQHKADRDGQHVDDDDVLSGRNIACSAM